MSQPAIFRTAEVQQEISPEEWETRVRLAALHRAVALFGWDDHIATHISARVPGEPEHMLLAPLGAMFREVTASSLVKTTFDGEPATTGQGPVNRGGVVIHGGVYAGRQDVNWILHLHTIADVAVSAQRDGLLALSQYAMVLTGKIGYHAYEGIALYDDERSRLLEALGQGPILVLRNHGSLVCSSEVEEAFFYVHSFQRACEIQIAAFSAGRENLQIADDAVAELTAAQLTAGVGFFHLGWAAMLRRINVELPGYDS